MTRDTTEHGDRQGQGVGALLREARTAQNLAVADVARQLKLSTSQVEAIETGDFGRLPGPVFVRGFVRNYARLLMLDVEPLLQAVASSLPREDPLPAPPSVNVPFPTAPPRRWGVYAGVAALVVAALAAYEYFPTASEPAGRESAAVPAPAPVLPEGGAPDAASELPANRQSEQPGRGEEPPTGAREPVRPVEVGPQAATPGGDRGHSEIEVAGATPPPQDASQAAARSPSREEELATGPGERQVRMVFDQASWVEIRDRSGKAIFSQLNSPGTEQRVSGRPPLVVVVGNAQGVRLTYDERPVNLSLHTKVDVARLTLP